MSRCGDDAEGLSRVEYFPGRHHTYRAILLQRYSDAMIEREIHDFMMKTPKNEDQGRRDKGSSPSLVHTPLGKRQGSNPLLII
jgi:hypothetical protein